jgi:uncharacterized protein YggE
MRKTVLSMSFLALGFTHLSMAAQPDSSRVSKTIEIQASAKVEAPAEIATVRVGYANHATTKDAAYEESTRTSRKIVRALLDQHVPLSAIETQSLALAREDFRQNYVRNCPVSGAGLVAITKCAGRRVSDCRMSTSRFYVDANSSLCHDS